MSIQLICTASDLCASPSMEVPAAAVRAAAPARPWSFIAKWLGVWRASRLRRAEYSCVAQMDDHLLSDIGASDSLREAAAIERNRNARRGWDLHIS